MEPVLIKISGNLVDDPKALKSIGEYIREKQAEGQQIVVIHGGGRQINELSNSLKVAVNQIAGRRVTNARVLDIILYTVGGKVNRGLTAFFRSQGLKSVGLTGIDGNLTTSRRRAPLEIDGEQVDFGLVGEITAADPGLVITLLQGGFLPVIGCLTWSEEEGILNINADTFAIELASALGCHEMVMLMQPEAVLDRELNPVSRLTREEFEKGQQQGWITDGMRPKLHTGFIALDRGVKKVVLTNPGSLLTHGGTVLS